MWLGHDLLCFACSAQRLQACDCRFVLRGNMSDGPNGCSSVRVGPSPDVLVWQTSLTECVTQPMNIGDVSRPMTDRQVTIWIAVVPTSLPSLMHTPDFSQRRSSRSLSGRGTGSRTGLGRACPASTPAGSPARAAGTQMPSSLDWHDAMTASLPMVTSNVGSIEERLYLSS